MFCFGFKENLGHVNKDSIPLLCLKTKLKVLGCKMKYLVNEVTLIARPFQKRSSSPWKSQ
jgi:hypothetical protein